MHLRLIDQILALTNEVFTSLSNKQNRIIKHENMPWKASSIHRKYFP